VGLGGLVVKTLNSHLEGFGFELRLELHADFPANGLKPSRPLKKQVAFKD
jgi:hypothetical protein